MAPSPSPPRAPPPGSPRPAPLPWWPLARRSVCRPTPPPASPSATGPLGIAIVAAATSKAAAVHVSNGGTGPALRATTGPVAGHAAPAASLATAMRRRASLGLSEGGDGIRGHSKAARGGNFSGGAAQIKLTPGPGTSHPATGETGDLYCDRTAACGSAKQEEPKPSGPSWPRSARSGGRPPGCSSLMRIAKSELTRPADSGAVDTSGIYELPAGAELRHKDPHPAPRATAVSSRLATAPAGGFLDATAASHQATP